MAPKVEKVEEKVSAQLYGMKVTADQVKHFIKLNHALNHSLADKGLRKSCLCIHGFHGIGKTAVAKQAADELKCTLYDVPIAQFEEMGDIHGMPEIVKAPGIQADGTHDPSTSRDITITAPPSWVPQNPDEECIILLDDYNRADTRILKGIMQLLQNYRTVTWSLPKYCTMVLTANPDGVDYNVTAVDGAQLSRLKHVTMIHDAKIWARWAERSRIDPRVINFLLKYQELLHQGDRCNPRTWEEFARYLDGVPEITDGNMEEVMLQGMASLDDSAINTFMTFLRQDQQLILEPDQVLNDFEKAKDFLDKIYKDKRTDIVSVISERIYARICNPAYKYKKGVQDKALQLFLTDKRMPSDMRYSIVQRIARDTGEGAQGRAMLAGNQELVDQIVEITKPSATHK